MGVTEAGFAAMARALLRRADECAGSKIAFLLEGGYDLSVLRASVAAVLKEMRKPAEADIFAAATGERIQPLIQGILRIHEKYR